jgi:hypothetical protein
MTEGEEMERRKLKSRRNSGEARALPVLTLAFNLGFWTNHDDNPEMVSTSTSELTTLLTAIGNTAKNSQSWQ